MRDNNTLVCSPILNFLSVRKNMRIFLSDFKIRECKLLWYGVIPDTLTLVPTSEPSIPVSEC